MEELKKCTKCQDFKSFNDFYTKGRIGEKVRYQSQCKKCVSVSKKKEYKQRKKPKIVSNIKSRDEFHNELSHEERFRLYSKILEL